MKININGTYYEDDFYWKYYSCLYDLPEINWKITKFNEKGIPYSYIHRLEPCCPTLVEDGGYIENLEDFKQLYLEREYLPEDGLELMRKSILACAKVSDNPIYQQLINKYDWND